MKSPFSSIKLIQYLGLALVMTCGVSSAQETGTIEVKVGAEVPRSYDDLKAAGYVYGPKQEVDPSTKDTHVWLPYGTKGVYTEMVATKVEDPEPGKTAVMMNGVDGATCIQWGYKLHFDKPISGFSLSATLAELGLKDAFAGVEYSVDGQKWVTLKQIDASGTVNSFLDPATDKATGLDTSDLTIRFYTRSKSDPKAAQAESAWFKLWTAGDPSWGDASTTFFARQIQIWVTAK